MMRTLTIQSGLEDLFTQEKSMS